jgi:acyl carrier protein
MRVRDVEIWQDGVVQELITKPGETIPVGTVMARPSRRALPRSGRGPAAGTGETVMDAEEITKIVLAELKRIAPELEVVAPAKPLRDQVDLDSMDWLNFLVALNERLKIEIPEADYRKLGTLQQIVDYLSAKAR